MIQYDKKNYRKHPDNNKKIIAGSLTRNGAGRSILLDKDNTIIAGNGVYEQANKLNIPVRIIETDGSELIAVKRTDIGENDDKRKDLALVDNLASDTSDFDMGLVTSDFDNDQLLDMGFDIKDLPQEDVIEDEAPTVPETPRTVKGDIYQLGNHRVMCGDSTIITDVEKLMDGKKADMVFTDPPYNVGYSNADRPKPGSNDFGKIKNDKMEVGLFKDFIASILANADILTKPDCSLYLWYASASASAILNAFDESGWKRSQEVIWKKPMLLGRSRYQWAHEPCIFAVKGQPFFIEDRTKTTVWDIGGYDKSKNQHPTQKPVKICEEGIRNSSKQEDIVLDLFTGSGSTLIACEQTNRICYGMELDEKYCDVIVQRWVNLTGGKVILNGQEVAWHKNSEKSANG